MPLYEYKCLKCGRTTEKIESVSGPHLRKCPHCAGKVESVISAPAIQFKGSGWYVTDYAGKSADANKEGKGRADGKDAPASDAASTDSSGKEAGSKDGSGKSAASKEKDASIKDKKPTRKK